tara:strand:+ start:14 stop:190 length:177 start_codon:yes stop_codon:yes gene_type:complete
MKKATTYTQEEILKNIEKLTIKSNSLKTQRTGISQDINSLKKQVKEWEDLNVNQFKMF